MRFTRAFLPSGVFPKKLPGEEIFFKEEMKKLERIQFRCTLSESEKKAAL